MTTSLFLENFIDFPIKNDANAKLKYYDKPIFLHFWNFKACDKLLYRDGMTPFLFDTKSENLRIPKKSNLVFSRR